VASHSLRPHAFGSYVLIFAIAISAANLLSVGAGNIIAFWVRKGGPGPNRLNRWICALSFVLIVVVAITQIAFPSRSDIVSTVGLAIGSVLCIVSMQALRGAGRLTLSPIAGFYLPSGFQVVAAFSLWHQASLSSFLFAMSLCYLLPPFLIALPQLRETVMHHNSDAAFTISVTLSISALALSVMFFILGQADIVSLTVFRGATTTGHYTPEMRSFEALTAWAIAFAFFGTARFGSGSPSEQRRYLSRLTLAALMGFFPCALALLLFGRSILLVVFGSTSSWSYPLAVAFSVGYALSVCGSIAIQTLLANAQGRGILALSITVSVVCIPMVALATSFLGQTGAGFANAISYAGYGIGAYLLARGSLNCPKHLALTSPGMFARIWGLVLRDRG